MPSTTSVVFSPDAAASRAPIAVSQAMKILLAINALPLILLPIVSWWSIGSREPYLGIALGATIQAQLFLLAFWMAFGGWPQRWRSLSIFTMTIACGLYYALSNAAVAMISVPGARDPGDWILIFVFVVMAPIVASGLLWMLSAIFIIPAWCFGYEINLRSSAPRNQYPKRTFSIPQLIVWTAQVALPLGSLNLFLTLTEDGDAALRMVAPFLAVFISGTPFAVALLAAKLPRSLIVCSCIWCLLVAAALWAIPAGRYSIVAWQAVFVYALTIAANLIALRQLGFCWQPRVA